MNVPDLIGTEVLTPDGRGSILSLHPNVVVVHLNKTERGQVMKGRQKGALHYVYKYEDVEIIKGQYCFNDERVKWQYAKEPEQPEPKEGEEICVKCKSPFMPRLMKPLTICDKCADKLTTELSKS